MAVMGQPFGGMSPAPPSAWKPNHPPSGRKQQGLLQTINKLEQESENRAFELINLRVSAACTHTWTRCVESPRSHTLLLR